MLVFIDDSGDPGFKLDKGSTRFFVIAMIIFEDELQAEETAVAIKKLRRELEFPDDTEFRFFKSSKDVRKKFLDTVKPFGFKIRALIVNKSLIYSEELKNNRNKFYAYFIKETLKHHGGSIINAKVRIDGGGDRIFRRNFITYLRRELNTVNNKVFKNCKMVDSRTNTLIQLADMIAGSINRAQQTDKKDCQEYHAKILKHIEDEWFFK
ncbi:MAG: DUF3800 domain-containing protein [Patescibacteria group bacterium]|nr:DUF3800 domain-containing protein [Patescibacteria group bacterium]